MQGVVKVYDPETGVGVILSDTGAEVMLRPGSLQGSLFRMLRQGQRVVFDTTQENDTVVAGNLRFGADGK